MNIKLLWITALTLLMLASCQKEELSVVDDREKGLIEFNDENSKAVPWEELPLEFQRAPILTDQEELAPENMSGERNYCNTFQKAYAPAGGNGGSPFFLFPKSSCDKLHGLVVRSGAYIDAIRVYYIQPDGYVYGRGHIGGHGGTYHGYKLDADEFVWGLGLYTGSFVHRIKIHTNKRKINHGGSGGTEALFNYAPVGSQILGFHGRAGAFIDQLGSYIFTIN